MRKRVLRVGAIDLEACRIEPKRKKKKKMDSIVSRSNMHTVALQQATKNSARMIRLTKLMSTSHT